MKKIVSTLIVLCLVLSTIPFSLATNTDSEELFVQSADCPETYIQYVKENVSRFTTALIESKEIPANSAIIIGTPFCFTTNTNIFYFPVFVDNEFTFLFRVFSVSSNTIEGIMSKFLVKEISEYLGNTSQQTPLSLYTDGNAIKARQRTTTQTIFEYPEDACLSSENDINQASEYSLDAINIAEPIMSVQLTAASYSYPAYKYLDLDICETQGNDSWCTAYSGSIILRYLGYTSVKARTIMSYYYPSPKTTDSLSYLKIAEYANQLGVRATAKNSTLTNDQLKAQLNSNMPVYTTMENVSNPSSHHAVVLRGYSDSAKVWSIWNPWYADYEIYSYGGNYIPTGKTTRYAYCNTVYNWTK